MTYSPELLSFLKVPLQAKVGGDAELRLGKRNCKEKNGNNGCRYFFKRGQKKYLKRNYLFI
jgi:hypothetical protein